MRLAATDPAGTLNHNFSFQNYPIAIAGKTGTAEYCDDVANAKGYVCTWRMACPWLDGGICAVR